MIALIFIAAILLIMSIIIFVGKGDYLIAGYNTASKQEREEYDVKRLRGLVGSVLIILAPMTFLLGEETMTATLSYIVLTFVLCIIVVILANTWAKKKSK